MGEFTMGKATTRKRNQTSVRIHLSVPPRIYARLEQMRDALRRELGPEFEISVATVVKRILYQHPTLRKLSHRHQPEPQDEMEL